jgi:hypothetical protein
MEEILRPLQEGAQYEFGSVKAGIVPKHIPPAILKGALPEKVWDEYFKFVFVRNPWDWFISQWFYNSLPSSGAVASWARRVRGRALGALPGRRNRLTQAEPASLVRVDDELRIEDVDAVFEVLKRFKQLPGRDGLYQSNSVYDMDGRMLVDFVGRYESLEADFAEIMERVGLNLKLPHLNPTKHRDYRSYYSAATRDRVAELWAIDIENFGYTFDPPDRASAKQPA